MKSKFCRRCVQNPASGLLQIGHKLEKLQCHNLLTRCHYKKFFDVALFLLLSLVTSPSFMSISSLVLKLWKLSFIRDWKSEIPPSEFCLIPGDCGELEIPNLSATSLMKCY